MSIDVKANGWYETYITGADILLVNNVIIDNFQQPFGFFRDVINNVLKSLLIDGLRDTARIDGHHRIVASSLGIAFDGNLSSQTAVEDDRDQRLNWHDLAKAARAEYSPSECPAKTESRWINPEISYPQRKPFPLG